MGGRSRVIELNSLEEMLLFGRHAARVLTEGALLVPDHKSFQRNLRPDFSLQPPGSPNIASMVGVEPGSPNIASMVGVEPGSPNIASMVGVGSAEGNGNLDQLVEPEDKAGREKMGQIPQNFCGRVLALSGPLGAGKTSFVQGLGLGLGIASPIQSPTFTYLHLYEEGRLCLYHFDLYRMKDASDFFAMGFEEYFNTNGIAAIEWPERLGAALPLQAVSLHFSYSGSGRNVDLSSAFEPDLINLLAAWD